ncbi:MAG: murein L,D-transpeptidase catalytic domain family protein [Bacteroidota bacterium]
MILKKLLFVFVLLLPVYVISLRAYAGDHDSIPRSNADKFMAVRAEDSSVLPSKDLLKTALAGYEILIEEQSISRPGIITIIDFSLPSSKKRLWVLDITNEKVLYNCLVSHGVNSGELMAENFSNIPGSNTSSPGFYSTGETYTGKHGLSLTLDGLEAGINDKARARTIVIHGAHYVSPEFVRENGRLGRSFGCPAVPQELSKEIIQTIKDGSCLFIYAAKKSYTSNSEIISKISSPPEI